MDEPLYKTGAVDYDELMARATNSFMPSLLKAARIAAGHHVLDVATGTGAAARAAADIVGRSGSVIGGDISPAMLEAAKRNLKDQPFTLAMFDAHALPYADGRFDAVICQLGLMFFSDPGGALSEFRRVLRPNGWTAVSVTTTPERSLFARIGAVIARYFPEKAESSTASSPFLTPRACMPCSMAPDSKRSTSKPKLEPSSSRLSTTISAVSPREQR